MKSCGDLKSGNKRVLRWERDCLDTIVKHYAVTRLLGSGKVGSVMGLTERSTKAMIAVKVLPFTMHDMERGLLSPALVAEDAKKELLISCFLNKLHKDTPAFIQTLGWLTCNDIPEQWKNLPEFANLSTYVGHPVRSYLYIFMNYGLGALGSGTIVLSDYDRKMSLFIILHGLWVAYAKKKFLHRDLHAGNIIFDSVPDTPTEVELSFGPNEPHVRLHNPNRHIPRIIDFGKSTLKQDAQNTDDVRNATNAFGFTFYGLEGLREDLEYGAFLKHFLLDHPFFEEVRQFVEPAVKRSKVDTISCNLCHVKPATTRWNSLDWVDLCDEYCAQRVLGLAALNKL